MMAEDEVTVPESGPSPKLEEAERDVALAHARFSADLRRASRAGERLTQNIVRSAKPALLGVAVVTGVALIVAVWRSRRPKLPRAFRVAAAPAQRPLWLELGRAALVSLATQAGRHYAGKLVAAAEEGARQEVALGQSSMPADRSTAR